MKGNHYRRLVRLLHDFIFLIIGVENNIPPSAATAGFTYSSRILMIC
jgi:hypothetical protein